MGRNSVQSSKVKRDHSRCLSKGIKTGQTSHYHYPFLNPPSSFPYRLIMVKAVVLGAAGQYSSSSCMAPESYKYLRWYWSTFGPSAQDKPLGYRGISVLPMAWHCRHTELPSSSSLVSMISSTPPASLLTSRTSQLPPRSRVTYLQMTALPRL